MSGEKVFITGATGFIGFVVLRRVLESGFTARVLVRKQQGADNLRKRLHNYTDRLEFIVASGSYENPETFDGLLQDVTYIIHIASPLPSQSPDYIKDTIHPAVNATLSVLKAASAESSVKRVVITSSLAAVANLGPRESTSPLNESDWASYELDTASNEAYANGFEAYCASKTIAEKAAWKFLEDNKPSYDLITLLPSYVIGRNELADKGEFVGQSNSAPFKLLTEGSTSSPFLSDIVHILDVADAHVIALDAKIPGNERFIITGEEGKWNDAIDVAKEYKPDFSWNFGSYSDAPVNVTNDKAVKILGIKFKPYKQAVKDLLAGYFEDLQ